MSNDMISESDNDTDFASDLILEIKRLRKEYGQLRDESYEKIEKIEQQLKEARKHLAESVAKECKCEVNISVNNDLVNRNLGLKQQLKEANEVAKFYGDENNYWSNNDNDTVYEMDGVNECDNIVAIGKAAREYLTKYKVKE